MREYQFITKGVFESLRKFEERLNLSAKEGWRVINVVDNTGTMIALLEKEKHQ